MRASVRRRLAPVLDAQAGVVTSRQLREVRVAREVVQREDWLRLADGVWCVTREPTDEQLLVAQQLYAPGAVPSGALACRRHELRHVPDAAGCDALVAHGTNRLGGPLLRLRQTRRMPAAVALDGYDVAPLPRAVADAARWSDSLQDVRALVLASLADKRVTLAHLEAERDGAGRRNNAHLTRALDDWSRGARSAPEAEAADSLLTLRGAGPCPPFLLNPQLWLGGVLLGSPDGWIPSLGLGWEMDSTEFHARADQLDATLVRHQRFADAGIELLHVTPGRYRRDRATWARDVVQRARNRSGWQAPASLAVVAKGPLLGGTGAGWSGKCA